MLCTTPPQKSCYLLIRVHEGVAACYIVLGKGAETLEAAGAA